MKPTLCQNWCFGLQNRIKKHRIETDSSQFLTSCTETIKPNIQHSVSKEQLH